MYTIYRGIALAIASITMAFGVTGTAVALEIDIGAEQMTEIIDLVQTFLISLGLLAVLVFTVFFVFIRWYMRKWGPGEIDPITATMFKPVIDRIEKIEERQEAGMKILLEDYHKRKAENEADELLPL